MSLLRPLFPTSLRFFLFLIQTERREADKKHRAGVQNESLKAIVKVVGDDETAKKILLAIIQNEIPNIRIEY